MAPPVEFITNPVAAVFTVLLSDEALKVKAGANTAETINPYHLLSFGLRSATLRLKPEAELETIAVAPGDAIASPKLLLSIVDGAFPKNFTEERVVSPNA